MGGNGMQTLLKEKTAKRIALTVHDETGFKTVDKTAGVVYQACCEVFRLMSQTDCQTFPSFTVHMNYFTPIFGLCKHPGLN
jgi:hypothetical protein